MYKKFQNLLGKGFNRVKNNEREKVIKQNEEIFKLFVEAVKKEEIQKIERWLLR